MNFNIPQGEITSEEEVLVEKSNSESREVFSYEKVKADLERELQEDKQYIEAAKEKRNNILEKDNFLLLKKDYNKLFCSPGNESELADIRQTNYRNARLTASIDALRKSPYFELIMRSILKTGKDGATWELKVPFAGSGKKNVELIKGDIEPETTLANILDKLKIYKNDTRATTRPLDSTDGFKVLESGILKALVPGAVNRKMAEEIIHDNILPRFLGDECFVEYRANNWEYNLKDKAYIDVFLEHYDPETFMATAETIGLDKEIKAYDGKNIKLKSSYAHYSITGVDHQRQTVSIADPDDTSKIYTLDFETFRKTFHSIDAARINHKKLLEQMQG